MESITFSISFHNYFNFGETVKSLLLLFMFHTCHYVKSSFSAFTIIRKYLIEISIDEILKWNAFCLYFVDIVVETEDYIEP